MQPIGEEEDCAKKRAKQRDRRGGQAAIQFVRVNDNRGESEEEEELPPMFVYADYKCSQDAGEHEPILICAQREDDDTPFIHYGRDCSEAFHNYADSLTEVNGEPLVVIVFHNFKGYDGMFILQQLHKERHEIRHQVCIGTKILSLKTGHLKFLDSFCFLLFPLAAFSSTFGIPEEKKGFFPHRFNTDANQEYEGPYALRETYDRDGMKPEKKAEFLQWYAMAMIGNCKSDVLLLKTGCMAFQKEFAAKGDFNIYKTVSAYATFGLLR